MTDYDPIRTCCSNADICKRCWVFISAAVHVIDQAIREQFGYQHLLWVYSGRRGIHLWISDKEAMELTDDQRKALVAWMTVIQGGKEASKRLNVRFGSRSLPPSLQCVVSLSVYHFTQRSPYITFRAALDYLKTIFPELILVDQDCFASENGSESLLELVPDVGLVQDLREAWSQDPFCSSQEKWADLKDGIQKLCDKKGSAQRVRTSICFHAGC
jgi:DNA primase small subunit